MTTEECPHPGPDPDWEILRWYHQDFWEKWVPGPGTWSGETTGPGMRVWGDPETQWQQWHTCTHQRAGSGDNTAETQTAGTQTMGHLPPHLHCGRNCAGNETVETCCCLSQIPRYVFRLFRLHPWSRRRRAVRLLYLPIILICQKLYCPFYPVRSFPGQIFAL